MKKSALIWTGTLFVLSVSTLLFSMCKPGGAKGETVQAAGNEKTGVKSDTDALKPSLPPIDTALYLSRLQRNANGDSSGKWPVKGPYPSAGAVLPFNVLYRIMVISIPRRWACWVNTPKMWSLKN